MEIPSLNLHVGDEVFEATPDNLELFTFAPWAVNESGEPVLDPSSRNHAFYTRSANDESRSGIYILHPGTVQSLGAMMLKHGFPARLNQVIIPACDEAAYAQYIEQQVEEVEDFFPDDWDATDPPAA